MGVKPVGGCFRNPGMGPSSGRASNEHVDRVLGLIAGRDPAGLRAELAPLSDGQRREAAAAVGAWSRSLRAEDFGTWAEITWTVACVAVIGTFSAPAAAATTLLWIARHTFVTAVPASLMIEMARERGLTWLPDLAGRLAARLGQDYRVWAGLDQILRAYGAPAPPGDRFVLGWLSSLQPRARRTTPPLAPAQLAAQQADWLQASPYLRDLLPRVFEAEGAWRDLEYGEIWRGLVQLSRREPGYRPQLLDGCLRRILLGGTAPVLSPFRRLWSELAPDGGEAAAARITAYTAVAGSAAAGLATRALKALHALEGQGRLGLDDLLDLSAVVLPRREKALVSAQLQALDRAAGRHPDRLPDILAAVEPAAQHGAPAIRTAAAQILRKHAASLPPRMDRKLTAVADATHR